MHIVPQNPQWNGLPRKNRPESVDRRRRLLLWLLPLLVLDGWLLGRYLWRRARPPVPSTAEPPPPAGTTEPPSPATDVGWRLVFPTPQTRLLEPPTAEVFMPTESGRVESALYGTTRTTLSGGRVLPSFHEGIDIAPTRRDRRGRPLDPVFAAGDGRVAYLQRHAGDSNYGVYVVLTHPDPLGPIYTLYAHLAHIHPDLREGMEVHAGQEIGRMGHTPASIIPLARAHLHFEIGVIENLRFAQWYRARNEKPDHGNWHGRNLTGLDPLAAFAARDNEGRFSMQRLIQSEPTAFELVCRAPRLPDYFVRYGALWAGEPPAPRQAIVLAVHHGGAVLRGRTAAPEETDALGARPAALLHVDREALRANGRRRIVAAGGAWRLSEGGQQWLEAFLY